MSSNGLPHPINGTSESIKEEAKIVHYKQIRQCIKNAHWEGMKFFLDFPKIEWNEQRNKVMKVGIKPIENVPFNTLATCIKLFQHPIKKHEQKKDALINIFTEIAKKIESGYYEDLNQFKNSSDFKPFLMFTLRKLYTKHLKELHSPSHHQNSTSPIPRTNALPPDSKMSHNDNNSSKAQPKIPMETSIIEINDSDDVTKSSKRKFEQLSSFDEIENSSDDEFSMKEIPSFLPPISSYTLLLPKKKDYTYTQALYGLCNEGKSCYINAAVQAIVSCIPHLVGLDLKLIISRLGNNATSDTSKLKCFALPLINLLVSMTINPIEQFNINKSLRKLCKSMNDDGEFTTKAPNDAGNCFDALMQSISTILFTLYQDKKNMYKPFLNLHKETKCDSAWQALIDNRVPGNTHWIVSNILGSVVKEDYSYSKCKCGYQHSKNTKHICHLKFVLDTAHIKNNKSTKLESLLEYHFKKSSSTITCPHLYCNKTINCNKSLCLYNLPKLFIIELNRMFKCGKKSVLKKYNGSILTPTRGLDLSSFLFHNDQEKKSKKQKRQYYFDLMHVISHQGDEKHVSHFTNYHFYKDSCWYHINDKSVVECNDTTFEKEIHHKNKSFLLIYKLRESMF